MEVAIRDANLYQAFPSCVEGMEFLGLSALEVQIDREGVARSLVTGLPLNLRQPDELETFSAEAKEHGLRVCAFLCAQDFNAESGREAHVRWVVQAVRAADALGVPALRIDSNMSGLDLPLEERIRTFSEAVEQVLSATRESQVALGIENHGRQGNDPEWMRGVIERVNSPRLGLTLDVGNWYWYGHPLSRVYDIYREFGPLVKATHVKNIRYPEEMRETQRPIGYEYGKHCCPLDEGDLDMARVAALLRESGYDGPLTIEDESVGKYPQEERAAVLQRDVEHLKAAIAA